MLRYTYVACLAIVWSRCEQKSGWHSQVSVDGTDYWSSISDKVKFIRFSTMF